MTAHSIIPPSSAYIWGKPDGCTGWVLMSQLYPDTGENPEAADGTASHWVGAETLLSYRPEAAFKLCSDFIDQVCPENGVVVTEEMVDGAHLYVSDVLKICQERGLLGRLQVEQRLAMPSIHELSFGTPDCWTYDSKAHEVIVWDYKFGHDKVEAFENWQGLDYADGIVEKLGFKGVQDQDLKITIRIVQPRAFHREGPVRSWETTGGALRAYTNILHANAETALGPDAVCNSGSHCKNCSARTNCETALTAGTRLFEAASAPTPVDMSTKALAVQATIITRAYNHLKALKTGYDAQIAGKVRAGEIVPGWTTEATFGRVNWSKPIAEVIAMGDMMGKDLRKPEAITPKKAVALGIDEAVITAYSSQHQTGVKVVPDNGNKTKQVFSL